MIALLALLIPQAQAHNVAVTVSPIHLTMPVVELTGELRAADRVGVGPILGAGPVDDFFFYEVGVTGRYYLLGSFDGGMQLGGEALWVGGSGDSSGVQASANALAMGPFLGGKYAWDFGLTLDGQLGIAYFIAAAEASGNGQTASTSESQWGPILNLNIGWSF